MNNNKIKILSVIVLLLFAGSLTIPFVSIRASCDMADYNSSCEMDMAEEDCCGTMVECTIVPFQPVISAPLNKVNLQNNLIVDYNISFSTKFNISEEYTLFEIVDKLCFSETHPGFQTPLLV